MHSLDPQGTQTSLANHLWLNYSMCTFKIRPYGRCSLELQILVTLSQTTNFRLFEAERLCRLLCTYPVIPSFVHVCIYFEWFPLWLFLKLDSL